LESPVWFALHTLRRGSAAVFKDDGFEPQSGLRVIPGVSAGNQFDKPRDGSRVIALAYRRFNRPMIFVPAAAAIFSPIG